MASISAENTQEIKELDMNFFMYELIDLYLNIPLIGDPEYDNITPPFGWTKVGWDYDFYNEGESKNRKQYKIVFRWKGETVNYGVFYKEYEYYPLFNRHKFFPRISPDLKKNHLRIAKFGNFLKHFKEKGVLTQKHLDVWTDMLKKKNYRVWNKPLSEKREENERRETLIETMKNKGGKLNEYIDSLKPPQLKRLTSDDIKQKSLEAIREEAIKDDVSKVEEMTDYELNLWWKAKGRENDWEKGLNDFSMKAGSARTGYESKSLLNILLENKKVDRDDMALGKTLLLTQESEYIRGGAAVIAATIAQRQQDIINQERRKIEGEIKALENKIESLKANPAKSQTAPKCEKKEECEKLKATKEKKLKLLKTTTNMKQYKHYSFFEKNDKWSLVKELEINDDDEEAESDTMDDELDLEQEIVLDESSLSDDEKMKKEYEEKMSTGIWLKLELPSVPHGIVVIIKDGKIFTAGGGYASAKLAIGGDSGFHYGDFYLYSPDHLFTGWEEQMYNKQNIVGWGYYDDSIKKKIDKYVEKMSSKTNEGYLKIDDVKYCTVANSFFGCNCARFSKDVTSDGIDFFYSDPGANAGYSIEDLNKILFPKEELKKKAKESAMEVGEESDTMDDELEQVMVLGDKKSPTIRNRKASTGMPVVNVLGATRGREEEEEEEEEKKKKKKKKKKAWGTGGRKKRSRRKKKRKGKKKTRRLKK